MLHELRTSCGNGEILLLGFKHVIVKHLICHTLFPRDNTMHCCYVTVCVSAGVAGSGRGQDCTENAGRDQPCRFVAWNHQRRLLCGCGQVRPAETELGIFRSLDLGVTSGFKDERMPVRRVNKTFKSAF